MKRPSGRFFLFEPMAYVMAGLALAMTFSELA
jgi:hypothetical protein